MEDKIYLQNLSCYERADYEQKSKIKYEDCFDLNLLPTVGLKEEFYAFLMERDRQMALATMAKEKNLYKRICRILDEKHIRVESLQVWDIEKWLLKIRAWLMENGEKLTIEGVSVYGKEKIVPSALITYFRKIYYF